MPRPPSRLAACALAALLAGCASRAVDVKPAPASPADFAGWECERIDDELDAVQQQAADVAYTVDERAGNNIVALGLGVTIFWPAILAMRPDGPDAAELARLKGRDEALRAAQRAKGCAPPRVDLSPARAAAWPIAVGERLVYEQRSGRGAPHETALQLVALRRDEADFRVDRTGGGPVLWRQDFAGNVVDVPTGALYWRRLLKHGLALGQVLAGEIDVAGDALQHARMRGQVVAIGPQTIAGRRFDAAVIELFGDATNGNDSTRVEGAIVVDRASGVLLRLDLRCAAPTFNLQRRLVRIEHA